MHQPCSFHYYQSVEKKQSKAVESNDRIRNQAIRQTLDVLILRNKWVYIWKHHVFLSFGVKRAQISPQLHVPPSGGCISNQVVIFTGVGSIISASTIYRRHNTNAVNRLFFTPDISGVFKKEKKKHIKC